MSRCWPLPPSPRAKCHSHPPLPLPALLCRCPQAAGLDGVHWRRRHGEVYTGKRKELIEALRAAGMPLV